jgi:hypothetical protein
MAKTNSGRYNIDEHPEHKARLEEWTQKWIANALSTEPCNRPETVKAIKGLYKAANLKAPTRIVFVRSPLAAAIAGSIASGVWWLRENPDRHQELFGHTVSEKQLMAAVAPACAYAMSIGTTKQASSDNDQSDSFMNIDFSERSAHDEPITQYIYEAILSATSKTAKGANRKNTQMLVNDSLDAANDDVDPDTVSAFFAAIQDFNESLSKRPTHDPITGAINDGVTKMKNKAEIAPETGVVNFLIYVCKYWYHLYNGGSDWSAYVAYLSFFDRVCELNLPIYSKWRHYEQAAIHSGPRMMHAKFCIVSDRHIEIHLDANNLLHREDDGPAKAYGDGWKLYYWHGVCVPSDFYRWDVERSLREENSEIRRCAIERIGWENLTDRLELVAEAPDPGNEPHTLRLYQGKLLDDLYEQRARLLVVRNGSPDKGGHRRTFGLPVPDDVSDPVDAAAMLFDVPPETYRELQRRT